MSQCGTKHWTQKLGQHILHYISKFQRCERDNWSVIGKTNRENILERPIYCLTYLLLQFLLQWHSILFIAQGLQDNMCTMNTTLKVSGLMIYFYSVKLRGGGGGGGGWTFSVARYTVKLTNKFNKWCINLCLNFLLFSLYSQTFSISKSRDGGCYNLPPVWNNIIKERLTDGAGPDLRNSVSVPVSLQCHLEYTSYWRRLQW